MLARSAGGRAMNVKRLLITGFGAVVATQTAYADDYAEVNPYEQPSMYSYAWQDPTMYSRIGIGINVGGGLEGFTGSDMRDAVDSDVGGMWQARVTIGSHIPVALDVAYVGTAVDITPLGALDTGTLVGTSVEGAARWNILPHYAWNPYVFGGLGWQRYDVSNVTFSRADSGLSGEDNLLIVPMGGGISYRDTTGIVFDVRGAYRWAEDSTLLQMPDGSFASLSTWEATAQVGYEF